MRMTPKPAVDLEVMAALAEKATPGPWIHMGGRDFRAPHQGDRNIAYTTEDAAFIAAARTFVPAAIEEIRELRAEVERLNKVGEMRKAVIHADDAEHAAVCAALDKAQADLAATRAEVERLGRALASRRRVSAAIRTKLAAANARADAAELMVQALECKATNLIAGIRVVEAERDVQRERADAAEAEAGALRAALEFYANESHYRPYVYEHRQYHEAVLVDFGFKARAALGAKGVK